MSKLVILDMNKNPQAKIPQSFITLIHNLVPSTIEVVHIKENKNLMSILKDASWIIGYPFPFTFIKRNKLLEGILFLSAQVPTSFLNTAQTFSINNIQGLNSDYVALHAIKLLQKLIDDQDIKKPTLTAGIIGSGSIAKELKTLIEPLPLKILSISRNEESDYQYKDYSTFLAELDIILPTVTLNPQTQDLFSKEKFFSKLKDNTSIVNIARGELFQEDDLLEFLSRSDKSFYYTDVIFPEPYPETGKLNNHPQIYRTNHVAGFGPGLWSRIEKKAQDTLKVWFT